MLIKSSIIFFIYLTIYLDKCDYQIIKYFIDSNSLQLHFLYSTDKYSTQKKKKKIGNKWGYIPVVTVLYVITGYSVSY